MRINAKRRLEHRHRIRVALWSYRAERERIERERQAEQGKLLPADLEVPPRLRRLVALADELADVAREVLPDLGPVPVALSWWHAPPASVAHAVGPSIAAPVRTARYPRITALCGASLGQKPIQVQDGAAPPEEGWFRVCPSCLPYAEVP